MPYIRVSVSPVSNQSNRVKIKSKINAVDALCCDVMCDAAVDAFRFLKECECRHMLLSQSIDAKVCKNAGAEISNDKKTRTPCVVLTLDTTPYVAWGSESGVIDPGNDSDNGGKL